MRIDILYHVTAVCPVNLARYRGSPSFLVVVEARPGDRVGVQLWDDARGPPPDGAWFEMAQKSVS